MNHNNAHTCMRAVHLIFNIIESKNFFIFSKNTINNVFIYNIKQINKIYKRIQITVCQRIYTSL